ADPSGAGEGERFLGAWEVMTDGDGRATVTPDFGAAPPSGYVLTATATDDAGNTSEFSLLAGPPEVTIKATDPPGRARDQHTGAFTVSRTGDPSLPLEVQYSVAGTATADEDYPKLSGTVKIPANAVSATITVVPIDDEKTEDRETVVVTVKDEGMPYK